jgi:hypothetical protein
VRSQWRECTGSREQGEVRFKLPMPSPPERAWVSRPVPRPIKVWSSLRPAPAWARPRCKLNARILLANLFLCDRAAVAALDSPCSWAFNDGICEAHLRHFGVRQQYPGVYLIGMSRTAGSMVCRPVGSHRMGAAVRVSTGRRRAVCGTMSVRAVRRYRSHPCRCPIPQSPRPLASTQGVAYGPADS